MKKVFAVLILVGSLVASGAWAAGPTDTASHTVVVNIPEVFRLELDTAEVLFDFGDATVADGATLDTLFVAGMENYLNFLEAAPLATQVFAPTGYDADPTKDHVTASVVTNQKSWTLDVAITAAGAGVGDADFSDNIRVNVNNNGYNPLSAGTVFTGTNAGKTSVGFEYALVMNPADDFPGGTSQTITLTYKATAP